MTAFPADVLGQMPADAAAIERASIYRREALWGATTGELINQARQQKLDAWGGDGFIKTVAKSAGELATLGLYNAGPGKGTDAIANFADTVFEGGAMGYYDLSSRITRQSAMTMTGTQQLENRDAEGRIVTSQDDTSQSITNKIANRLFYGSIADPSFIPDDKMVARYGMDNQGNLFDQETLLKLAKSGSEFEMSYIRAQALHQRDRERRLSTFSTPSRFALDIIGGFGDPVVLASGLVAGEIGGAAANAFLRTTSGTLARMSEGGLIARSTSALLTRTTAKGVVPGYGFRAVLSGAENIGQNAALSAFTGDDYSWKQASIDASLGALFSVGHTALKYGYGKIIKSNERGTIADANATTTPKAEYYFAEVPGHRPTASPGDLARLDSEAADLLAQGKEPVLPNKAFIAGRDVRTPEGLVGKVVGTVDSYIGKDGTETPFQVLVDVGGRVEAHGPDSLSLDRVSVPTVDSIVRLEDGTLGKVTRIEGDSLIVEPASGGDAARVPAWLFDQKAGKPTILRGEAAIFEDGKAVLAFLRSRNKSTPVHELAHTFRRWFREMDAEGATRLNDHFGEIDHNWSTANEERFARAFERYLADGQAPTPNLKGVFDQFKKWLSDLWASLKGEAPEQITPELKAAFDKMLGGGDQPIAGAPDRAGPNYKRVRDQAISVLGKDGQHTDESRAFMALATAYGQSWARGTGKSLDDFFRERLVGIQGERVAPDHFARRMIGQTRKALITPDRRFDWIDKVVSGEIPEIGLSRAQWRVIRERGVKTPGMIAWEAERARREANKTIPEALAKIDQQQAVADAAEQSRRAALDAQQMVEENRAAAEHIDKVNQALADKPTMEERGLWMKAGNRLVAEDPNVAGRPLSVDEYTAIVGELARPRLQTANGIVTVVDGMNGHARIVDGRLQISPWVASLPAAKRLSLVRNAILARDIVTLIGEEAAQGRPVPRPTVKQVAAWMDLNGLAPMDQATGVAAAAVSTMERMHNPLLAADTLIGGLKNEPPQPPEATGGTTADLPPKPDAPASGGRKLGPIAHINDAVIAAAESMGVLDNVNHDRADATTTSGFSGVFFEKLPPEVLDIIDQYPETRSLFQVTKDRKRGMGADALSELGPEQYAAIARELAAGDYTRAVEAIGSDPAIGLLDRMKNDWENQRGMNAEDNRRIIAARRLIRQVAEGRIGIVSDAVFQSEAETLKGLASDPKKYAAMRKKIAKANESRTTQQAYDRAIAVANAGTTPRLKADILDTSKLPEGASFKAAGVEYQIVQGDGGLHIREVGSGRPDVHANLPTTIPIDPGSLYVPKGSRLARRAKWLAKKEEFNRAASDAIEYQNYLERERLQREAIEAEISDAIRHERESLADGQDPAYQPQNDPVFAQSYEQNSGTNQNNDSRVFDPSGVIGGRIKWWGGKLSWGRAVRLRNSLSSIARDTSAILFDTPLIDENNSTNANSGEIFVKQKVQGIYGATLGQLQTAFKGFADARKMGLLERERAAVDFGREVGRLAPLVNEKIADPHVKAAVEATRAAIKEAHGYAKANGVDIPDFDPTYFTRLWSAGRKATLIKKLTDAGVTDPLAHIEKMIAGSILERKPNLDPAEADALAKVYAKRIDEVSSKSALDRMRTMSNIENFDRTFAMLKDEGGMDEASARALAEKLAGSPGHGSRPNVLKERAWVLDDRHSIDVPTKDGAMTISMADLMETDAATIVNHYTRALVSEGVVHSTLRTLSERYGKSIGSVESLLTAVDDELRHAPGVSDGTRVRTIKSLQTGISLIKGLPTHETTALTQIMQAVNRYNFVRSQGGFAVSAGFELMGMPARTSMTAMLQTVPLAREIYKQIRTGKIEGALARAVLSSMGTGFEGQIRAYLPDIEARSATQGAGGAFLHEANRKLGKAQSLTSRLTGFEQINTFSQVWARTAYLQHLINIAKREGSPSATRLAGIGLDVPTWNAIAADIRKNATPTPGAGSILFDLNLDSMEPVLRTRLLSSVDAKSRQLIQEGTIGGSDYWLETPAARMVTQFRQFMMQAHEKQLLANVQQFDGESAAYFLTTLGLGGLQYAVISYLDTRGADDPEAELKKRLTPARLGYGAFTRAAFSGIAPTMMDTGLQVAGVQPLTGRRMTGATSYSILDNPTAQLLSTGAPSIVRLLRAGVDPNYDVSQQDVKGALSMIPLNRFPGIVALSGHMISDLPKKPQPQPTDLLKELDSAIGGF